MAELFAVRANTLAAGFGGVWSSTFGRLSTEQEGREVRGSYDHKGGTLRGTLDGRVLRGTWCEPEHSKEGSFELHLDEGGNGFRGSWKYEGSAGWNGEWNGVRLDLAPEEEGGQPGGWNSLTEGPLLAGPMIGEVGETEARIWIQARDREPLTLTLYSPDGSEIDGLVEPAWDSWLCDVFHVQGLRPGASYDYEIRSANGSTERRRLKTAPPRDARRAKIAFGSCFWEYTRNDLRIFDAIGREQANLLLLLGDTSYFDGNDLPSEHTMMLAHLRNRNNEAFRRLAAETSVLGVWDDHDFGPNDVKGHFEGRDRAYQAFRRCWAQASFGLPDAPGMFSSVRVGPAEIFLLDERYYRGTEGDNILGARQLAWLLAALSASDAPVKVVASPSQVLPEHPVRNGWDCFRRDAPEELEALLSGIEASDIRGVVFVSGDLHMANLMHAAGRPLGGRRGPDFWELTASPLANAPWREPQLGTDRYLLREVADRTNYGVVDIDLDRTDEEITLVLKDEEGETFFTQPIALDSLRVR